MHSIYGKIISNAVYEELTNLPYLLPALVLGTSKYSYDGWGCQRNPKKLMSERTLDEIFNEFARAFIGSVVSDHDIAFPNRLPRQDLNFSLASLHQVDHYLAHVYKKRRKLTDSDWSTTVLWGGAYVGEVIRGLAPADYYRWIDYHEYMLQDPGLQSLIPERTQLAHSSSLAPEKCSCP